MGLGQAVSFLGTLLHWNSSADAYGSFKYLLIATLVLAWALCYTPRRGLLSVVSILYMVVLTFVSLLAWNSRCFIGSQLSYFTGVLPCFLVFACYHYSIGDKWQKIADAFIAACVVASLMAIGQCYGMFLPQGDYFGGRAYAAIGSPVFLAATLAMAIPLCLGRGRWFMAIPVLSYAILLTQSRSGILATLVGVLGYCFARSLISLRVALILAGLSLVGVAGVFSGIRNTSASDRGRYQMIRVAAKSIADNPIFGIGPERFGWIIKKYRDEEFNKETSTSFNNSYIHNHILEAIVAGGPLLLACHLLLIGTVGLFAYRVATPPVFGAAAALCAFGLMQPTPLLLKCVLASIMGALDPSDRPYPKAPFIAVAALTFCAALSTVVMAKIYKTAINVGLAQMAVDSYRYQPSAINEGGE